MEQQAQEEAGWVQEGFSQGACCIGMGGLLCLMVRSRYMREEGGYGARYVLREREGLVVVEEAMGEEEEEEVWEVTVCAPRGVLSGLDMSPRQEDVPWISLELSLVSRALYLRARPCASRGLGILTQLRMRSSCDAGRMRSCSLSCSCSQ